MSLIIRCPYCRAEIRFTLDPSGRPVTAGQLAEARGVQTRNLITDRQLAAVFAICRKRGLPVPENVRDWGKSEASSWIQNQDAAERRY